MKKTGKDKRDRYKEKRENVDIWFRYPHVSDLTAYQYLLRILKLK